MAITWNIDEARATIQAQMDEANRLDGMIDAIAAVRDAANAEVARLSHALVTWQQCGDAIMLCATGRAAPRRCQTATCAARSSGCVSATRR